MRRGLLLLVLGRMTIHSRDRVGITLFVPLKVLVSIEEPATLLRVVVTYTDGTGSGRGATSAPTERVDQRGAVTLSTSVPDVGMEVTATLADPDGGVRGVVWQWQTAAGTGTPSWGDISDADAAAYTPVAADEGKFIPVTQ